MNPTGISFQKGKRRPPKRAPMGTTPEQLLDDLRRVHEKHRSIGVHIYRQHGKYSEGTITRKFGKFNRAIVLAGLPVNYATQAMKDELLGPTHVKQKRTFYPCWKCKRAYQGMGHRKGDWFCDSCRTTVREQAANMAWLG